MKNEQQTSFRKKVTSKRRGKNRAFYAFTHTRLFSMASNFFDGTFLQFSPKFCTRYTILNAYISISNFVNNIF